MSGFSDAGAVYQRPKLTKSLEAESWATYAVTVVVVAGKGA